MLEPARAGPGAGFRQEVDGEPVEPRRADRKQFRLTGLKEELNARAKLRHELTDEAQLFDVGADRSVIGSEEVESKPLRFGYASLSVDRKQPWTKRADALTLRHPAHDRIMVEVSTCSRDQIDQAAIAISTDQECRPCLARDLRPRKAGGERAAAIYSVIETAKLNGIEPQAYIADVIEKIASGWPASRWDELMPWNWQPAQQQQIVKAA